MIATTGTWECVSLAAGVEQSLRRTDAEEMPNDAQGLDSPSELARQESSITSLVFLRKTKWPQFFVLWQIIGSVSAYDAFLAMKYRDELFYTE